MAANNLGWPRGPERESGPRLPIGRFNITAGEVVEQLKNLKFGAKPDPEAAAALAAKLWQTTDEMRTQLILLGFPAPDLNDKERQELPKLQE